MMTFMASHGLCVWLRESARDGTSNPARQGACWIVTLGLRPSTLVTNTSCLWTPEQGANPSPWMGNNWASILSPEPLSQHMHNELPSAAVKVEGNQNQLVENTFKRLFPSLPLLCFLLSPLSQFCSPLLPIEVIDCHVETGWDPTSQRSPFS